AVVDGYKRLLSPSMENEIQSTAKKRADEEAVRVFAENLRQLLLAPPLGQKRVMAIDPGFRTGCKVVCLDSQGKLLKHTTVYPHEPHNKQDEATKVIGDLCEHYQIEMIAVGNGTAGRETETFVRTLHLQGDGAVVMVSESGASVYSASEVAREEFPDYDVTVRGAVSIGRRLMDPLAELVKIEPKAIGVGQYQHDVDQKLLKEKLDDVVESCVNKVGVELNTASKQLLSYVSGLGPKRAQSIVEYRDEHGPFRSREELKKVPGLGKKAFEQAAGFLRIRDGVNPLDASAVHPESYRIVEQMARDLNCVVRDLMEDETKRAQIDLKRYTNNTVGLPTLGDIMEELAKPGRDPRETFKQFSFAEGICTMEDLKPGMKVPGIVTNITNFGAFVDIGVHQDGLVHISELSDRFVKDPAEVIKLHQQVQVTVLTVDIQRKRIGLSMKKK
ncbi:MAG: helix-hairpin-helix domain-containing protein, partial [Thermodesulfobacteriota bacterium]|nr:helix-hairpin-helix domain-containing protein [Thermodesulfobacteriota bacterium]